MQVINVFEVDNKEHAFTLIVNHPDNASVAGRRSFERSWDEALAEVMKERPETWVVDEVLDLVRKAGWEVIRPETMEVSF